jgi:hypothetical protein
MAFTVTYNGNGSSGGSVPIDGTSYASGQEVTVLGNTGNLTVAEGTFAYWNTAADGSGTQYGPGAKFAITADVTLYAQFFITTGLTGGGVTAHFSFSYDRILQKTAAHPTGPEPARTNAVIAVCEQDYNQLSGWFGGISLTLPIPLVTHVLPGGGGAGWGPPLSLSPGSGDVTLMRYLIVSEVTEMFMYAQNKGWFAPDGSNEQSCGEGLSRFLAQQFLVLNGLGIIEPGYAISPSWLNSSIPAGQPGSTQIGGKLSTLTAAIDATATTLPLKSAPTSPFVTTFEVQVENETMFVSSVDTSANTFTVTRGYAGTTAAPHASGTEVDFNYGSRSDWVNTTIEYDHGIDAATGCAMLFIYYLHIQLGFSINAIIGAAPGANHAASCLRGVYQNLTNDPGDPFPFFAQLLNTAFPSGQPAVLPTPNPDNPWPIGILSFWGLKNTWGHDEVNDIIDSSGGVYLTGFWLMLEGFNQQVVGGATPTTPTVAFTGVTTTPDGAGPAYETTNPYVPQRIRFPYDVDFASSVLGAFPSTGETPALVTTSIELLGASFPASTEFFFTAGADPYFTNVLPNPNPAAENAPWLSEDLRVFTATPGVDATPVPGAPAFGTDSIAGAYGYIQALIGHLNASYGDPTGIDPFGPTSNVIPGQLTALTGDSSVTPNTTQGSHTYNNYNFALARVRLRGTEGSAGAAEGVKVFFRLWGTQTADTDWNPGYTYLSDTDASGDPLWPEAPADDHTIPFFATGNAPDFTDPTNPEYGTHGINNQTITIEQGDSQWAYFGCFLNLYDQSLTVNGVQVVKAFPGSHHCLVAQIAYAGAPIENIGSVVMSPETSDQLAQRNLQVTSSDNPGGPPAHRVPQTFDLRLSTPAATESAIPGQPDELMIDWGEVPAGSLASIYWPQVDADAVLALADRLYGTHALSAADAHTLKCVTTDGVTYVPIPFGTGESLAGLFTIDLPTTVVAGQAFTVVVRRIGSRRVAVPAPPPVIQARPRRTKAAKASAASDDARSSRPTIVAERYVIGSFAVRIPVATAATLLHAEETALAIFKARLAAMSPTNRWHPVLRRYISYLSGRVDGLGGKAGEVPPSFGGFPAPATPGGGHGGHGGLRGNGHRRDHDDDQPAGEGKVAGLIFDAFGDFEGFVLDTGTHERVFDSRERDVWQLAERAWRERLRITVLTERTEPHRIRSIIVREPPARVTT